MASDKGDRAAWVDQWLEDRGIEPFIPQKDNEEPNPERPFDREAYRRRNAVERLVGRLKEARRLFSRFE